MAKTGTQGGTHEQHVKAGQQSHKNTPAKEMHDDERRAASTGKNGGESHERGHSTGKQGGTHEQHVKAGQQSHKNS